MQAKKYKIEIHDSMLDWSHGFGYIIIEYHIPDLHLFVNSKAIFYGTDEERIPEQFELVELSPEVENDLKALAPLIEDKNRIEERVRSALELKENDYEYPKDEIEEINEEEDFLLAPMEQEEEVDDSSMNWFQRLFRKFR